MTTTEPPPITDRQREVLNFVRDFREQKGYCCTVRDIMRAFGIKSPQGVTCHLHPFRRKGYVAWEDGQARTLRPLDVEA